MVSGFIYSGVWASSYRSINNDTEHKPLPKPNIVDLQMGSLVFDI